MSANFDTDDEVEHQQERRAQLMRSHQSNRDKLKFAIPKELPLVDTELPKDVKIGAGSLHSALVLLGHTGLCKQPVWAYLSSSFESGITQLYIALGNTSPTVRAGTPKNEMYSL